MLRTTAAGDDGQVVGNKFGHDGSTMPEKDEKMDKEKKKSIHPHLSSYFMDLDEFFHAKDSCNDSKNDKGRSVNGESETDPAGLFPNRNSASQSRLFIPTARKSSVKREGYSTNGATSNGGGNYSIVSENRHLTPVTPPALLSAIADGPQDNSLPHSHPGNSTATSPPVLSEIAQSNMQITRYSSDGGSSGDGNPTSVVSDIVISTQKRRAKRRPREYIYNPKPFKQKAVMSSRIDAPKDESYWDKRLKNNVAAKRSRENRRKKEIETLDKCTTLEHENAELRERISTLEKQNAWLEGKLTRFLLP